jgi:hypothetical protein
MARARKKITSTSLPPPPSPSKMNIGGYDNDDNNDKRSRGQSKWKIASFVRYLQKILSITTPASFVLLSIALILASIFVSDENNGQSTMMKIGTGYIFVARPILSTMAIVCDVELGANGGGESKNLRSGETTIITRIIALSFFMSIVCNQFPRWLSAIVACFAIFAFGLASRQLQIQPTVSSSQKEHNKCANEPKDVQRIWARLGLKERAALAGIGLVISMLIENFLIWVVSATYQPGMDGTSTPLQDNGRIVLEKLAMKLFHVKAPWMAKRSLQKLRNGLNVQWALVSAFGASLVCLELQLGQRNQRSLGGLTFRALSTLATARIIRTISFALTVLPSQVPNCYASHFPVPPENWAEWLMVGFLPNTRGGCNDLILSGHATVTSTIACAFTSVASNTSFSIAVWTLVALDYSIEAYEGLHYSVDMWLGCIVTCLLWHLLKSFEFGGVHREQRQQHDEGSDKRVSKKANQSPLDATILGMYALPATLAFLVLTVVPVALVNYFLVGYSIWAGVVFARCGFTIYVQHILICELCFGLGAYL